MASRAFSTPRSLHMLVPILVVSLAIFAIAMIKGGHGMWERFEAREVGEKSTSNLKSAYYNSALRFSMLLPDYSDVAATLESGATQESLGRVGGVSIDSNTYGNPSWSILAYTSKDAVEKDFAEQGEATFADFAKKAGLETKSITIDGKESNIYYGVHPVDGVGGSDYDYVAAEVVGPTWTYMIQFRNMGKDPDAASIVEALKGFDAR